MFLTTSSFLPHFCFLFLLFTDKHYFVVTILLLFHFYNVSCLFSTTTAFNIVIPRGGKTGHPPLDCQTCCTSAAPAPAASNRPASPPSPHEAQWGAAPLREGGSPEEYHHSYSGVCDVCKIKTFQMFLTCVIVNPMMQPRNVLYVVYALRPRHVLYVTHAPQPRHATPHARGGRLLGPGTRLPPPLPALRANLVAKGQQVLAIHIVAPKALENFFSFALPILSTLHPNIILEPNLDSNAHPNPQPTPNPTPKPFP